MTPAVWLALGAMLLLGLADLVIRAAPEREVAAWGTERNAAGESVNWRFTTADARIKLTHLYPSL